MERTALGRRFLEFRTFFSHNGSLYRTNLKTNSAVNTSRKINPIPVCALGIFPWPFVDAGHRTSINTIRNPLTNIGHYGMSHCVFSF
jgi:hypothetical protein